MDLRGPLYIFAAFALYSALHSALAARSVKEWVRNRFGETGKRYYRLVYNVIGVVTLLPILALLAAFRGEPLYTWPSPWILVALVIQGAGALIIVIGLLQTGVWSFFGLEVLSGGSHSSQDELITSGLYGCMRHPLYTGGLLMLWFMPIMTTSLLAFNIASTLYLYVGSIFEEQRMLAAFGEDYARYRKRVPRLIPIPGCPDND